MKFYDFAKQNHSHLAHVRVVMKFGLQGLGGCAEGDLYAGFAWKGLSEQVYFSCKFSKNTDNLFFIKKRLFPI